MGGFIEVLMQCKLSGRKIKEKTVRRTGLRWNYGIFIQQNSNGRKWEIIEKKVQRFRCVQSRTDYSAPRFCANSPIVLLHVPVRNLFEIRSWEKNRMLANAPIHVLNFLMGICGVNSLLDCIDNSTNRDSNRIQCWKDQKKNNKICAKKYGNCACCSPSDVILSVVHVLLASKIHVAWDSCLDWYYEPRIKDLCLCWDRIVGGHVSVRLFICHCSSSRQGVPFLTS